MKMRWVVASALASAACAIQAQDMYGGDGEPGLVTLGSAQPMGSSWGLRGEYTSGLNLNKDGVQDGVNATGSLKASRAGVFADWFPFGGGFRLVGGLTVNDIKAEFKAIGGNSTINGKMVNLTGETFNVNVNYPASSGYLGIGWGHQASKDTGFGFYADLGVMFGSFASEVNTSLVNKTIGGVTITQADIDAQTKSMRDSIASVSVLPSVAIGLTYRF